MGAEGDLGSEYSCPGPHVYPGSNVYASNSKLTEPSRSVIGAQRVWDLNMEEFVELAIEDQAFTRAFDESFDKSFDNQATAVEGILDAGLKGRIGKFGLVLSKALHDLEQRSSAKLAATRKANTTGGSPSVVSD